MAHLDRAVLDGVGDLQARDDFARREQADLELAVGRLGHVLREELAEPKIVSSDFGKLDAMRHFSSGADCAMAGAANVPVAATAAVPMPAVSG